MVVLPGYGTPTSSLLGGHGFVDLNRLVGDGPFIIINARVSCVEGAGSLIMRVAAGNVATVVRRAGLRDQD